MKIGWEQVEYKYDPIKQKWMINGEEILFNEPEQDEEEEGGVEDFNMDSFFGSMMNTEKMVNTPFGMFELKEAFNPLNHFDFWIGHTDFDIDEEFVYIANRTAGIEGIKVMSRYRFLIAVGKMFTMSKVRAALELNLGIISLSPSVLKKKDELLSTGEDWVMYVYPDLESFEFTSALDEDFYNKMNTILKLNENQSGILLSSNS